jgi:hypothetical protein
MNKIIIFLIIITIIFVWNNKLFNENKENFDSEQSKPESIGLTGSTSTTSTTSTTYVYPLAGTGICLILLLLSLSSYCLWGSKTSQPQYFLLSSDLPPRQLISYR